MEHVPVESSSIATIAHDPHSSIMQVLFKNGGLYEYDDVSPDEFFTVLQPGSEFAGSVGHAYASTIKGKKASRKIDKIDIPLPTNGKAPEIRASIEGRTVQRAGLDQGPAAAPAQSSPAEVLPPEAQAVSMKSAHLTAQAGAIEVTDPATQERASEVLLAIASIRREISETFKPMKDAAFKAHRVVCDQERKLDEPLATAELQLKLRISTFIETQERLARQAEEAARQAELARATAEATQQSQELALEQAIDLEARGDSAGAEAVLANPAPVPPRYSAPAPVAPNVARVKGVSTVAGWDFRIVDISQIPREYLMVNETAIRNVGKNTQGRARIAGVEFFPTTIVRASRGR